MTLKLIAFTSAACAAVLFVPALLSPHDPFFDLLISTNLAVMIVRLVLVLIMVGVALKPKPKFKYKASHQVLLVLAALLFGFALVGLVDQRLDYELFNIFKPLDYLISLIASSFMIITYFEYAKGRAKLPQLPKPYLVAPKPSFNLRRLTLAKLARS